MAVKIGNWGAYWRTILTCDEPPPPLQICRGINIHINERTSGSSTQTRKFETIMVANSHAPSLRLRIFRKWPEVVILGADRKNRGLWGREWGKKKTAESRWVNVSEFAIPANGGRGQNKFLRFRVINNELSTTDEMCFRRYKLESKR